MKLLIFLFLTLGVITSGRAQFTSIPDAFFELYLVNQGIDTDGVINGQVLTSDISDETELVLDGLQIEDLSGLEDFASLEFLSLAIMPGITSLDISQNGSLGRLSIDGLNLATLDVSHNLDLYRIFLSFFADPPLNMLTILDVSNNLFLDHLNISGGFITNIDVSNNTLIDYLELVHMDDLDTVNLKSGNNESIDFLRILDNPNLLCVQVDNPASVIAGIDPPYDDWIIENDPLITDDCQLGLVENLADQIKLYPNPLKEILHIETNGVTVKKLSLYDILGRLVLEKNGQSESLDTTSLQRGWFILKLETETGVFSKKLLKE